MKTEPFRNINEYCDECPLFTGEMPPAEEMNAVEKATCRETCRTCHTTAYGIYKFDINLARRKNKQIAALAESKLLKSEEHKWKGGGKTGRTILTKPQQAKVFADIESGKSITAIAKELVVSRGVIYRLLKSKKANKNCTTEKSYKI